MNGSNSEEPLPIGREKILVIDDEKALGESCCCALLREGHEVDVFHEPQAGLKAALSDDYDIIFLDLKMPEIEGLDILRHLKAAGIASEVVIITGHSAVASAVEVMQEGAADYLAKPFTPFELKLTLDRVTQRSSLLQENAALRRELEVHQGFEGIVGDSHSMKQIFSLLRRIAPTDETVLVTGEGGTGKEMVVRAIHRLSRRKDRPLIACDCSALVPTLLESELFGHVKGLFSGAIVAKQGLFETAHRGTLFLDEIASINLETQGKLLRVLETREVRRVGDTLTREIDIRLIAATNQDLVAMVAEGTFREDLYDRLHVIPVDLSPLHERKGDIPLLAMHFMYHFARQAGSEPKVFAPEAMAQMESYRWPGNIRELRNVVQRIVILCDSPRVEPRHLPPEVRGAPFLPTVARLPHGWHDFKRLKQQIRDAAADDLERRYLFEALERCGGNVTRTAESIGMRRTNLHALLRKHGLRSNMAS